MVAGEDCGVNYEDSGSYGSDKIIKSRVTPMIERIDNYCEISSA